MRDFWRRLLGVLGLARFAPPAVREHDEIDQLRERQRDVARRLAAIEARIAVRGHREREEWHRGD